MTKQQFLFISIVNSDQTFDGCLRKKKAQTMSILDVIVTFQLPLFGNTKFVNEESRIPGAFVIYHQM